MKFALFCISLTLAMSTISLTVSAGTDEGMCSEVSSAQIAAANPAAEAETFCDDSDHTFEIRGECSTNAIAYENINKAIQRWGVVQRGEIVATIAWMLYESAGWKYNIQHYPNYNPQVGTRAMLNSYNLKNYAWDVQGPTCMNILLEALDKEIPVNTLLEDIVQLVLEDEWSFGAGFWFLATQATGFHNQEDKLRSDNQDDFVDYMRDGVKANLTSSLNERLQWWQQANSFIMVS